MPICAPLTFGALEIAWSTCVAMVSGSAPIFSKMERRLRSLLSSNALSRCVGATSEASTSVAIPRAACSASWAVTAHLSSLIKSPSYPKQNRAGD